jgi:predicted nucleic acid-binding protein
VRVFLDSSVIISACGSAKSLSRLIWQIHSAHDWQLISSSYCRAEVARNVVKFGDAAVESLSQLGADIDWVPNALTSKRQLLLAAAKDKPVLISALAARCDALLTLDVGDFELLLGTEVYGMLVTTPRDFLIRQDLG